MCVVGDRATNLCELACARFHYFQSVFFWVLVCLVFCDKFCRCFLVTGAPQSVNCCLTTGKHAHYEQTFLAGNTLPLFDKRHLTGMTWRSALDGITGRASLAGHYLTAVTWRSSLDDHHLTVITWRSSLDGHHMTVFTSWSSIYCHHLTQFDGHHLTVVTWRSSLDGRQLTVITLLSSLYGHHLTTIWRSLFDSHQLTVITWRSSLDGHQLTVINWRSSIDGHHLTVSTWRSALDGHHLTVSTWRPSHRQSLKLNISIQPMGIQFLINILMIAKYGR